MHFSVCGKEFTLLRSCMSALILRVEGLNIFIHHKKNILPLHAEGEHSTFECCLMFACNLATQKGPGLLSPDSVVCPSMFIP